MNKKLTITDIYTASYLDAKGIEIELSSSGKWINFHAPPGTATYRLIQEFNENHRFPILNFVSSLKKLRSKMMNFRKEG